MTWDARKRHLETARRAARVEPRKVVPPAPEPDEAELERLTAPAAPKVDPAPMPTPAVTEPVAAPAVQPVVQSPPPPPPPAAAKPSTKPANQK